MKRQTTGVYLLKNNKVLFLVRKKKNDIIHKQGMYLPIGGHVELGEGITDAAIREVKEESGVTLHSIELKGIVYIRSQNTGKYDMIIFTFTSSDFSGEPKAGNEGAFAWVDKDRLQDANLYPGDKIYLDLMFKYQFFIVEFLYKKFDLIGYNILKVL